MYGFRTADSESGKLSNRPHQDPEWKKLQSIRSEKNLLSALKNWVWIWSPYFVVVATTGIRNANNGIAEPISSPSVLVRSWDTPATITRWKPWIMQDSKSSGPMTSSTAKVNPGAYEKYVITIDGSELPAVAVAPVVWPCRSTGQTYKTDGFSSLIGEASDWEPSVLISGTTFRILFRRFTHQKNCKLSRISPLSNPIFHSPLSNNSNLFYQLPLLATQ